MFDIFFALTLFAASIIIAEALYYFGWNSFLTRKIGHMLCGLSMASLPVFLTRWETAVTCILLIVIVVVTKKLSIFDGIERAEKGGFGTAYFPLGGLIAALLLWPVDPQYFSVGILVLGFADAGAAIVGKFFGKHTLPFAKPKTYEGAAAFFIISLLIMTGFLLWIEMPLSPYRLGVAVMGSILLASLEVVMDHGSDNIAIPLLAGSLLLLVI